MSNANEANKRSEWEEISDEEIADVVRRIDASYGSLKNFFAIEGKEIDVKNPIWDQEAISRYCKAILLAFDIFGPEVIISDPKEATTIHGISVNLKLLDLCDEKLDLFKKLVSLCDYISGEPGKGFMSLDFCFFLCREL